DLGLSAEGGAVDEADLLAVLAVGRFELAVHGQAELGDHGLGGELLGDGIPGEVPDDDDFVYAGHGSISMEEKAEFRRQKAESKKVSGFVGFCRVTPRRCCRGGGFSRTRCTC